MNRDKKFFRFHLRRRLGKKAVSMLEKRFTHFVMLMPVLMNRIDYLTRRFPLKSSVKRLKGQMQGYVGSQHDFLPTEQYQLFGYMDDAYFVSHVYQLVLQDLREEGVVCTEEDELLLKQVKGIRYLVKKTIPEETKAVDGVIQQVLDGGLNYSYN